MLRRKFTCGELHKLKQLTSSESEQEDFRSLHCTDGGRAFCTRKPPQSQNGGRRATNCCNQLVVAQNDVPSSGELLTCSLLEVRYLKWYQDVSCFKLLFSCHTVSICGLTVMVLRRPPCWISGLLASEAAPPWGRLRLHYVEFADFPFLNK